MSFHRSWAQVGLVACAVLLICGGAQATTYMVDAVGGSYSTDGSPRNWYRQNTRLDTGSMSESVALGFVNPYTAGIPSSSQTYPYKVVLGYKIGTTFYPKAFAFSRESTAPVDSGPHGTVDPSGTYYNSEGVEVDPETGEPVAPPTPDKYTADATVTNSTDQPITYNLDIAVNQGTEAEPQWVNKSNQFTLQPGQSTNLHMEENLPFDYQISYQPGLGVDATAESGEFEGTDYGPVTVAASGSGAPEYDTGTGAGGVGTPGNGTPTATASAPTTAASAAQPEAGTGAVTGGSGGVTGDDMKQIGENLGEKIDRTTAQVKSSGDQAHKDSNALGGKLDKLLNGKGEGSGSTAGQGTAIEVGEGSAGDGVLAKINTLMVDAAAIAAAITSPEGGSTSLNVVIAMPEPVGSWTLDIDQHGWAFSIVRGMLLALAITLAAISALAIVRGALVDQG